MFTQFRRGNKLLPPLVIGLLALGAVGIQFLFHGIIISGDTIFHFTRFYDTAMQIKTGHFNYFQLNYGFYHSGRIINAVYGPLFAYCSGALLLLVHSYLAFELITSWLCYFVAGMGMRALLKGVKARPLCGWLLTIIYMNAGWVPRWQTATNTTAWGAALAPWIILMGVRMVTHKQRPIVWWQLALVTSLLIQIHVLSSLILVITLIPFALVGLLTTPARLRMIIEGCLAVIVTLVLTASFWAPYLELTHSNLIANPNPQPLVSGVLVVAKTYTYNQAGVLLGVLLLFGIQFCLMLFYPTRFNVGITLIAAALLAITTNTFPWTTIQTEFPTLIHTFQFPSRIYVAIYPLFFAGLAYSINFLPQRTAKLVGITLIVVTGQALFTNIATITNASRIQIATTLYGQKLPGITKKKIITAYHSYDLGKLFRIAIKESPDYLAVYHITDPNSSRVIRTTETKSVIYPNISGKFHHSVTKDGTLRVTWTAASAKKITVPVNTYHNSVVTFNGSKVRLTSKNVNVIGAVKVKQRKGKNTLTLNYRATSFTKAAIATSIWAWVIFCCGCIPLALWRQRH